MSNNLILHIINIFYYNPNISDGVIMQIPSHLLPKHHSKRIYIYFLLYEMRLIRIEIYKIYIYINFIIKIKFTFS